MDTSSSSISILDRVASAVRSAVTDTDWNAIAPASTVNFISVCSDGLAASREAFFFPLLTAASATLGCSASIKLNEFWPEPAILWTAVLADDKCRKTTAVHRFIVTSLKEAMDHLVSEHAHEMFMNSGPDDVIPSSLPTVRPMSDAEFEVGKLASSCREGSREWFLFSRDLRRVYRTLQSGTRTNSESDACSERYRDCFYDLQSSGLSPWSDETGAAFSDFRFNLTGFIHPDEAVRLINSNNSSPASHGFLDSTVAIVPGKSGKVYHSKPLGSTTATPLLAPILARLRKEHRLTRVYSLDDEAHSAFASYYNDVEERLDRMSTEDAMWRILSKSQGQVARLALVLHCLDHVTQVVCEQGQIIQKFEDEREETIPERISAGTMYNAINLMRMCIRQKTELINSAAVAKERASDVAASSSALSGVPDTPAKFRPVGSPRGVADNTHATTSSESRDHRNTTSSMSSSNDGRTLEQLLGPEAMNMNLQTSVEHRPTTSPQLTPRRVVETTSQTSRPSQQPVQPVVLSHSNAPVKQNSGHVVPINIISSAPMGSAPQRFPVAVSINPGGPKIVHVSYTPQGSSNTVTVHPHASKPNCNLVSLTRVPTNVKASGIAPVQKKTSMSIPPRAPSRMISPVVARALGRKVMKRYPSQPISSLPTSHDFKNFMEICPGKARRILMQGLNSLEAVWVAQRKLIPPIVEGGAGTEGKRSYKYPTNTARALLTALADAGLGEMVSRSGSRSGKSTFRKRKYENLSPSALETLRRLNISKQQYTHVKNLMYSS